MNKTERAAWLRQQADEIDAEQPPQTDPHEWTGGQAIAAVLREMADTLERAE